MSKFATEESSAGQFYAVCIGMDRWTGDATLMQKLFVNTLNYSSENVHVLNDVLKHCLP